MINMNYEIKKNLIKIYADNEDYVNLEFFKNKQIRIYKQKNEMNLYEVFFNSKTSKFNVDYKNNKLKIDFYTYNIEVDSKLNIDILENGILITAISFKTKFCEFEKKNNFETNLNVNNNALIFGLGDRMGYMNRKGRVYQSYNTDDPSRHDELTPAMYKSINYMLINNNDKYYGIFFPSTYRYIYHLCEIDLNNIQVNNFDSSNDLFLFLGKDVKEITANYSSFVGHPYFVRLKTLGFTQSRWSYKNEEEVTEVFNNFKKYDLPLDYINLDIHYMDGYRDYTVDNSRFPDLKRLSNKLKENNVELVIINDAAIKVDPDFYIYKYLINNNLVCNYLGKPYVNVVWPGDSVFPNYIDDNVKLYFNEVAEKFMLENGISGLWNDMNEPASFKGPLPDDATFNVKNKKYLHKEIHNVYAEHMVKKQCEIFRKNNIRPYVFSRAAFATTSKYSFIWNGDNFSIWSHLKYSIPQCLSLSLCNFMFNGDDIGGFGLSGNKELLIRWFESNLFIPYLRDHSSLDTIHQEPYAYDEETLNIIRKFLNIRYKFIPYLYDLCEKMSTKGELIIRPLFYNYPDDKESLKINDEYMVGESLLIAPIFDKTIDRRMVYLPKGTWIDYFNGKKYKGNQYIVYEEKLGDSGYFIKDNSIIVNYENLKYIKKDEIDTLVLNLYGNKGKYINYEDDGLSLDYEKGKYNFYDISFKNNVLEFKTIHKAYDTDYKNIKIIKGVKELIVPFKYDFKVVL